MTNMAKCICTKVQWGYHVWRGLGADWECLCIQLCAALQHLEQDRDAQTARLVAQLEEVHADAERTAAAAAAEHAKAYAELEERAYRDLHQVELGLRCYL